MVSELEIMHCHKCDNYFPAGDSVCSVCGGVHLETKAKNYRDVFLGIFLFFIAGCFLSPPFSFVISLVVVFLCYFSIRSDYKSAAENGGYYQTEKTLRYKIKHDLSCGVKSVIDATKTTVISGRAIDNGTYFDEFENDQSVIWTDADHDEPVFIEFSYRDRDGVRSRRDISLLAVSVCGGELYFTGHCFDRGAERTFKVNRITSKILFNDAKYGKNEFIDDVLYLDASDFS